MVLLPWPRPTEEPGVGRQHQQGQEYQDRIEKQLLPDYDIIKAAAAAIESDVEKRCACRFHDAIGTDCNGAGEKKQHEGRQCRRSPRNGENTQEQHAAADQFDPGKCSRCQVHQHVRLGRKDLVVMDRLQEGHGIVDFLDAGPYHGAAQREACCEESPTAVGQFTPSRCMTHLDHPLEIS